MMSAFVGRRQSNLPDISKKNGVANSESVLSSDDDSDENIDTLDALIEGKDLLGDELTNRMRDQSEAESIPVTDRAYGRLNDDDDILEKRMHEVKAENNKTRITLQMLTAKETRPDGEPQLETKKRAGVGRNFTHDKDTAKGMKKVQVKMHTRKE